MTEKKPFWPDRCQHLSPDDERNGVFVGSTVSPDGQEKWDVYIWAGESWRKPRQRQVCIRYGERGDQYQSCFDTPEVWSDPNRTVTVHGSDDSIDRIALASEFEGSAMELVRAYLEREKNGQV